MRIQHLLFIALSGAQAFAQTYPGAAWETTTPAAAGFDSAKFSAAMSNMPSPAVVIRSGRIVGSKGDPTRPGYIYSASKSLTALVFGTLLQRGLTGMDQTVPGSDNPYAPLATFRHFLSMTSDYHLTPHAPGQHYAYNNNAVSFLGDHLNSRFFSGLDKLGMLKSAYLNSLVWQDALGFSGTTSGWGGGWQMSSRDLARIGLLVLRNGNWKGVQLIPSSFISSLYSNQVPSGATAGGAGSGDFDNQTGTSALLPGHYSFGWWLAGGVKIPAIMMSGSYGTRCFVVPSKDLVIASSQADGGVKIPEPVINMFIDAIVSSATTTPTQPAPAPATTAPAVSKLVLINADTNQPVAGFDPLPDGAVLNVATLPTRNLNVLAVTQPPVTGSVRFTLNGSAVRTENGAPYAMYGDNSGDYLAWRPGVGSYSVGATAYSGSNASGVASTPLNRAFTVVDQASAVTFKVVSFTLMNADTNLPVSGFDPIPNGATLRLSALPARMNIRANTSPSIVGSVVFTLDGAVVRTEGGAPYSLAGDSNGNYWPWTPGVGSHTLSAVAWSGSGATGTQGGGTTIAFTVTQ